MMEQRINIFLSSTFRDMHVYRDCLIYEISPLINQKLNEMGIPVRPNFIDLRWGVDERKSTDELGRYAQILETCFRALDETDLFIGLYSDYRGTFIPEEDITLLNEEYQWALPQDQSLTELEYWYCRNTKKAPTRYCQMRFTFGNGAMESGASCMTGANTDEMPVITLKSREDYAAISSAMREYLVERMTALIEEVYEERRGEQNETMMVRREDRIEEIIRELFIKRDITQQKKGVKLTLITGESGIGKSVLLGQLAQEIESMHLYPPVYLPNAATVRALDTLVEKAMQVYGVKPSEKETTLAGKIRHLKAKCQPYLVPCFLIDCVDDLNREAFYHFLLELEENFEACHVITSTTQPYGDRYGEFLYRTFSLQAFDAAEIEMAVRLHEKHILKQFSKGIRERLLAYKDTAYARPLIFQLILNDLTLLSAEDYSSIMGSASYSQQIEEIMRERMDHYPSDLQDILQLFCTRVEGSAASEEDNALIRRYLALMVLSEKGIREDFLQIVLGEEWNSLLFYQLRYSFRNVFLEEDGRIRFAHHMLRSQFERLLEGDLLRKMAAKIVAADGLQGNELVGERYRMFFYLCDFKGWQRAVRQDPRGWQYTEVCLREFAGTALQLDIPYLKAPVEWLSYLAKAALRGELVEEEYARIMSAASLIWDDLEEFTTAEYFGRTADGARAFLNGFSVLAQCAGDEAIEREYVDRMLLLYRRMIAMAVEFSMQEMVEDLAEEYEELLEEIASEYEGAAGETGGAQADADRELQRMYEAAGETGGAQADADRIMQRMAQMYDAARYKADMDGDIEEIKKAYRKILQISEETQLPFGSCGAVMEYLMLHGGMDAVQRYLDFWINRFAQMQKEGYSPRTIMPTFMIRIYHLALNVYLREPKRNEQLLPQMVKQVKEAYEIARELYERMPEELQTVYDYSMMCSDMIMICHLANEQERLPEIIRKERQLKSYLHHTYPDNYAFAKSYAMFLENCVIEEVVLTEEERLDCLDEAFSVLVGYLALHNVASSWDYLIMWEMRGERLKNEPDALSDWEMRCLKRIEKYLKQLPQALQVIFDADAHNLAYREETLQKVGKVYNIYRFIAERENLQLLGKTLYDLHVVICDLTESEENYRILASTIITICADQAKCGEMAGMDNAGLLKKYRAFIEGKIQRFPERVYLQNCLLKVPLSELYMMVGILAGAEEMPEEKRRLLFLLWERADVNPFKLILKRGEEILLQLRRIKDLGGRLPLEDKEPAEMILQHVMNTNPAYRDECRKLLQAMREL